MTLQKYFSAILDTDGRPMRGAQVRVVAYPGGAISTIYEDDDTTVKTNPITVDADTGEFSFSAASGTYSFVVMRNGTSRTIDKITLGGGSSVGDGNSTVSSMTNGNGTMLTVGQVGYVTAAGTVSKATSLINTEEKLIVLVSDASIANGIAGNFKTFGELTGLSGGTAGEIGYLSQTGTITTTVPTIGAGDTYLVVLGYWLSATKFFFNPRQPILL